MVIGSLFFCLTAQKSLARNIVMVQPAFTIKQQIFFFWENGMNGRYAGLQPSEQTKGSFSFFCFKIHGSPPITS